ncbi:MAG: hypothetical protein FD123_2651 [Bacteroidetes bacterium]|nr:MAG: hypothetical protein FD123_2651 [Bacteroidota bacterium]
MSEAFYYRARFILIAAIALMIPLNFLTVTALSGLLTLLFLAGLLVPAIKFRKKELAFGFLFIGFYLWQALTLLYTEHRDEGLFNLQVKLSLFGFPLGFMLGQPFSSGQVRTTMRLFIAGCALAALICLGYACYRFNLSGNPVELFYTSLSFYVHPGYMAMFTVMACVFVLYLHAGETRKYMRVLAFAFMVLFVFFLAMLQSKAGIMAAVVCIPLVVLLLNWRTKKWKPALLFLALAASVYWSTNRFIITNANSRIYNATYNITHLEEVHETAAGSETSEVRVQVWKTGIELLQANWLTGVGLGDVKFVLKDKYREKEMTYAYEHGLNAHNQFLQSALAGGIVSLLLLILGFVLPGWRAMRQRQYLYLVFLGLAGFNFMVESMFEVQAGTIFYGFFNAFFCFLAAGYENKTNESNKAAV